MQSKKRSIVDFTQQELNMFPSSMRPGTFRESNPIEDMQYMRTGGFGAQQFKMKDDKFLVKKSQLKSVMKSKLDIYNIMTKEGQLYLPPFNECPMLFINDIISGKKKVFQNH